MTTALIFASLVLFTSVASARRHRRPARAPIVSLQVAVAPAVPPSENAGATMKPAAGPSPLLDVPASFFDDHASLVRHDLLFFKEESNAENRSPRGGPYSLAPPVDTGFVPPSRVDDQLEQARQRDRLLLLRNQSPSMGSAGIGFAMFGAMTMTSAHAPRALRPLFDGPVHLGPALFENGAMGGGIGGGF